MARRHLDTDDTNYTPWIIGAVVAILLGIGIWAYAENMNMASNDTKQTTTSQTVGSGGTNNSTKTPAPANK